MVCLSREGDDVGLSSQVSPRTGNRFRGLTSGSSCSGGGSTGHDCNCIGHIVGLRRDDGREFAHALSAIRIMPVAKLDTWMLLSSSETVLTVLLDRSGDEWV